MMINKLKVMSIAICCLIVALCSETQGMENQTDILESATVKSSASMQLSAQNEIDDFTSESVSSQLVNLENSKVSWMSYFLSPVVRVAQKAYDIVDYTTRNPQKAAIIGVFMAAQFTAVAADCCVTKHTFDHTALSCTGGVVVRSFNCPEESPICSLTSQCYVRKMINEGCGGLISNAYVSVFISPGTCPPGGINNSLIN
jgi:hypothetical protein